MAQSGWYDDPDGTAGRLRFWDGTQWTTDTMPKPEATAVLPPAGAADPTAVLPPATATPESTAVLPPATVTPESTAVMPPVPAAPTIGSPYGPLGSGTPAGIYAPAGGYATAGGYAPGAAYAPQNPAPQPPRRKIGPLVAVGVLVLLIALVAAAYGFYKASTTSVPSSTGRPSGQVSLPTAFPTIARPTVTVPGQTSAPTIPEPSGTTPLTCALPDAGQLTDGTITVTMPATWKEELGASVPGSDCYSLGDRTIVGNWATTAIVADYPADGRTSQQVAEDVWKWNVDNNYAGGPSKVTLTGNTVTSREATTVGGKSGYKLGGQVTIGGLTGVPGDDVIVLVLENADASHSVLLTTSVIGDAASKAEVDSVWSSIKVG